jgi:glycosyltransferase involved in cell wall biosynthesis
MEHPWDEYHALLLPSRSEGLPLVVQEAMAAGRISIAGNAGGTAELVKDGENGFLGEPNLESFTQALERAWERRSSWEELGTVAFQDFNSFYPTDAVPAFSQTIQSLLND